MAIGIIIPVLPKLVESMAGGDTARAAEIFGIFGTAWGLMQFVFSPVLGALSDRYGRRPVMLISTLGLGLDYVLMAVAPEPRLAVRRPRHIGHRGRQLLHGQRLHRRRDPARAARRLLRPPGRRLRHRLRARPRAGRRPGRHRPAPAVLGRRRPDARQLRLRRLRAAEVAARRSGAWPSAGPGPIRWARCACWRSTASCWASPASPSSSTWRTWCCRRWPCSTPATATAGTTRPWG